MGESVGIGQFRVDFYVEYGCQTKIVHNIAHLRHIAYRSVGIFRAGGFRVGIYLPIGLAVYHFVVGAFVTERNRVGKSIGIGQFVSNVHFEYGCQTKTIHKLIHFLHIFHRSGAVGLIRFGVDIPLYLAVVIEVEFGIFVTERNRMRERVCFGIVAEIVNLYAENGAKLHLVKDAVCIFRQKKNNGVFWWFFYRF